MPCRERSKYNATLSLAFSVHQIESHNRQQPLTLVNCIAFFRSETNQNAVLRLSRGENLPNEFSE